MWNWNLSPFENVLLRRVVEEKTYGQIADELERSEQGIALRMSYLEKELGVNDRWELEYGLKHGTSTGSFNHRW